MDFISQYSLANSGTDVPIRFTRWSAIALLSATIGRRLYIDHHHFVIYPWLYYCLVGDSSSGKSTAMKAAKRMFTRCFPTFPTGVSVTSREDIVKFMSSEACSQYYTDEDGTSIEWKPLAQFVNELSNFMSFNPSSMIEFLTDIFDERDTWSSSTIKRNKEEIVRPFVALLACTVPDYIIRTFKASVIGGGFSRRIIFVYEDGFVEERTTFPEKSQAAQDAEIWCDAHLTSIAQKSAVQATWTEDARSFLIEWNRNRPFSNDPVLAGYHNSKDITVQKIAMCLAYAQPELNPLLTVETIETAIALLEANEDNLPKLTVAAGRNELAFSQMKLVQLVDRTEVGITLRLFHTFASKEMNEQEYNSTLAMLRHTEQLFVYVLPNRGEIIVSPRQKVILTDSGAIPKPS